MAAQRLHRMEGVPTVRKTWREAAEAAMEKSVEWARAGATAAEAAMGPGMENAAGAMTGH